MDCYTDLQHSTSPLETVSAFELGQTYGIIMKGMKIQGACMKKYATASMRLGYEG